ncbi:MAG: hypothetical protein ACRESZ_18125 [Methylococcales bacterium]
MRKHQASWVVSHPVEPVHGSTLRGLVFRHASNQDAIRREKDKIKAYLLEIRLFKDDLGITLGAEKKLFKHSLAYMGHCLVPIRIMIVPFALILAQVESRFALKSLETGQETILSVTLDPAKSVMTSRVALELPPGLSQTSPAMRIEQSGQILWRIISPTGTASDRKRVASPFALPCLTLIPTASPTSAIQPKHAYKSLFLRSQK